MLRNEMIYTATATITAGEASAGKTVTLGFSPRWIRIWNATQGLIIEWMDTLEDADYFQITDTDTDTAEGSTPSADGVKFVTTGGITIVDADIDSEAGFSIDAGLCTESDVLHILAI